MTNENAKNSPINKVLSIAPYTFLPATSGGRRGIYFFSQHLGSKIRLVCISTKENALSLNGSRLSFTLLPIFGSSFLRYFNLFYYFKIRSVIKKYHLEAVILEQPFFGWMGVLIKRSLGLPLIVRSHNIEGLRFKSLHKWWSPILAVYEKWVHRNASLSFFITKEDQEFAIKQFGLQRSKTEVITYGVEMPGISDEKLKKDAVMSFKQTYNIPMEKTVLLFNGIFGYAPNDEALKLLIDQIFPRLIDLNPNFYLVICGGNIPKEYETLKNDNILVMGFVPDIAEIFFSSEIFLNPIWNGGGIKTKLVEAIGASCSVVSFSSGAIGLDAGTLNGKLKVVEDENVDAFVNAIIEVKKFIYTPVSPEFRQLFDWNQIADTAVEKIQQI